MWFSVVYSFIDNDTRHHSGQNVVDSRGTAEWASNKFWPLWWRVSLSTKLYTTLNHIRFVFYHNVKETISLSWQLNTPTRIWKCTRCIMQMSCLYASVSFKNFWNPWEKSNDAYSLSIRVHTTKNHISIYFLPQYQHQKKCFFFRAWAEKGIAWHIDASSVVETLIYHRKLANQNARSPAIVVKLAYRYTVMTVDPGSVVWDNVLLSNLFMCKLALINK